MAITVRMPKPMAPYAAPLRPGAYGWPGATAWPSGGGDPVAVEKCVLRDVAVSHEALRARVHAAPWVLRQAWRSACPEIDR